MRAGVVAIALLLACCAAPINSDSSKPIDAQVAVDVLRHPDTPRVPADASGNDGGFTCRNQVTTGNDQGHHNPGMDCMDSCHNHGFTAAGTLYTDAGGGTIVSGATITVIDSIGNTYDFASQTNGNFYTSFALLPPVSVYISECPTIDMMTAQLATDAQAGCNQTGCHASGSTQGRVHLP
jgi:hypothetical protein